MSEALARVLVADDEAALRGLLQRYLTDQGCFVRTVGGAPALDKLLARERFDVLVLDLMMPGEDGLAICRRLRALVRRAVVNLVENALRHGRAPVALRTGSDARWAWIEVADAGPGIAAADIEAVKQPFRRAGATRQGVSGAGLGLAIVERIARSHDGTLDLLPVAPHGLLARLRLPLAPAR